MILLNNQKIKIYSKSSEIKVCYRFTQLRYHSYDLSFSSVCLFEVNEKIINLNNPLLTEESKEEMEELFVNPIDPEERTTKNVIKMMIEDGIVMAIPGGRDGYINFLTPFLRIIKKENLL